MTPRRLVVSYDNSSNPLGQQRLRKSCEAIGQPIACYGPDDNFTPHSEVPYFFKVDAMVKASRTCRVLLWLDSSVVATGLPLDPIFEHIESAGHLLTWQGWSNAEWCNDRSLAAFSFTRDQAARQKQVRGGFWGVNLDRRSGALLLRGLVNNREYFKGSWTNQTGTESDDLRCLGHRHDQSVMALIAASQRLDILDHDANNWCCYGADPKWILNILGRA